MKKFTHLLGIALMALMLVPQVVMAQKSRVTLTFVGSDGNPVRQAEATIGEDFTEPRLTCDYPEVLRSVTYSSSGNNIATVNPYTGEVTPLSVGTVSIIAYFAGNDNYYESRATYNIIVKEPSTPPVVTCPDAKYYYNGAELTTMTLKVGDVVSIPALLGAAGQVFTLSAKTVEGIRVAELTEDDMIHAVGQGTAMFIGGVRYQTTDTTLLCEYSFYILVEAAAPEKLDPQFSFNPTSVDVELGEAFVAPQLLNPNNIVLTPMNSKWYTAWDSKVAQVVNEQTGEVNIIGVGDETISFEFTGNETYKNAIISYTLHVTTMGLTVGGVNVTNKNAGDILGDQGSIVYDPLTHTLKMTNATINGAGMNLAPSKGAKADNLPASGILYTDNYPLTIVLNGSNAISGADAGIYTVSAPVVMMGSQDAAGSLAIRATTVGIKAEGYKIYKCSVVTYGGSAGVATNELGVATGGYIHASGGGLAIQANSFVKAEDNNGEGIDILTAGVTFQPKKGFFDAQGQVAKSVEIGKIAIVVPDDEVTEITFTETDPNGNESVIFSADANNTYNETTGQLEITTTLTDEVVANALETLVPGSSQWMDLLPGSLVFDIPAGEGEIEVKCMTIPGYSLQIKMEGKAAVSITQSSLGWAKVVYNVTEPIHVVIYLHATTNAAPARIPAAQNDTEPTVGAYIEAIKITPKNAPTAIDVIEANRGENGKILLNGQLYIIREGRVFTATGIEMK